MQFGFFITLLTQKEQLHYHDFNWSLHNLKSQGDEICLYKCDTEASRQL